MAFYSGGHMMMPMGGVGVRQGAQGVGRPQQGGGMIYRSVQGEIYNSYEMHTDPNRTLLDSPLHYVIVPSPFFPVGLFHTTESTLECAGISQPILDHKR